MAMLCKTLDSTDLPMWLGVMKGKKWVAEIKEDGDRIRMKVNRDGTTTLLNRHGKDVSEKYPEFFKHNFTWTGFLDGEMCVLDNRGVSQFNTGISFRTHCKDSNTIRTAAAGYPVIFVVFDILEKDMVDLRGLPYTSRRAMLESLNLTKPFKLIEMSEDIQAIWNKITKLGGEGLILKNANAAYYEDTRSPHWLKVKDVKEADVVFHKYEVHNKGITLESNEGHRVTCNGSQCEEVRMKIDKQGQALITIRHLGVTEAGRYRQPVFMKMVVEA